MAGALTLRVITPDRIVLDQTTHSIRVPATDGLMGILPRHAHMVAALDVGVLTYEKDGKEACLFVSGGFLEVRDGTVRVVSEAGELPEEIDTERAKAAEERARKRLHGPRAQVDVVRAELALRRAAYRLTAAGARR
ncbi:MAG TPA: F0F1 ATP synthase subunit epsilon [Planctomycetes bacterium]|nr:F0F1 ATP synthase subunit epsilon [Planctomycetota bacterium]